METVFKPSGIFGRNKGPNQSSRTKKVYETGTILDNKSPISPRREIVLENVIEVAENVTKTPTTSIRLYKHFTANYRKISGSKCLQDLTNPRT